MELPERSFSFIYQHIKNQYHPHQKKIHNLEIRNLVYWISRSLEHVMHHLQEEKWSIFPSFPNLRIGLWRRSVLHMFGWPDNCFHIMSYFALGCGCTSMTYMFNRNNLPQKIWDSDKLSNLPQLQPPGLQVPDLLTSHSCQGSWSNLTVKHFWPLLALEIQT